MGTLTSFTNPEMFRELYARHGATWRAGGYLAKSSQNAAFLQLRAWLRSRYRSGDQLSLLDVGGGCCDIIPWLAEQGLHVSRYGHVEPVAELRQFALDAYGSVLAETVADLQEVRGTYDVAICIGVLSHWEGTLSQMKRYCELLVDLMDQRAALGVAINCPSPYADWLPREKKALSLDFVAETLKKKSERVLLNLDECPHLLLGAYWKAPSRWRLEWSASP